jgi:acyl dehydratase
MGLIRPTNPFRYDIDGGSEWEYLQPVKVGDTLIATAKIVDIYQKQGSPRIGPMVFNIIEVTYRNQVGDPVVVARGTIIYYEGSR